MRYELADYEWIAIKPMLPNKPRVLQHADKIAGVGKACRHFGVVRADLYRWLPIGSTA